ncbi:MAG: hypothetical protein JXJ04_26675 [Spirochaetales bacterium]|nr:hypothetical protein [Spirochaetales bacterium]
MRRCIFCGHTFDEHIEIFRSTLCPECGKEVKICLHCTFYSPGAHWDCRETIPESVREKDRANFCSYFSFKKTKTTQKEEETPGKHEEAKDAFNKLFGD